MSRRLLLISNSICYGQGYLDHCMDEITDFLAGIGRVLFVPFAGHDHDAYGRKVTERFAGMDVEMLTLVAETEAKASVEAAEAFFVGGGNTFRLLKTLQETGLLTAIRERVLEGVPYIGSSAGANIACPTIHTTNDMPIVQPASFEALGVIPFQINPHYLDAPASPTHMGETREKRIEEYLEENDAVVVGLREGAWIRVEGRSAELGGQSGARIFRRGAEPEERSLGNDLSDLL